MELLSLADDLTGALEVGAKFAAAGLGSRVVTLNRVKDCGPVQALVVDTETRHTTPDEARSTICRTAVAAGGRDCRYVYKKTDSTLRGNIAAELSGLSAAFPGLPIVYVPGYPEMGRAVVDGRLLVDGIPVCRTAFARDPRDPVESDDVPALVGRQIRAVLVDPAQIGGVTGTAVYIVNTATGAEVRQAAGEFCRAGLRLAAGPAGFAGRIAEVATGRRCPLPARPPIRRCLVVNGSLNPRSLEQVRAAPYWRARSAEGAATAFSRSGWVLLDPEAGPQSAEHSRQLGKAVADVLQRVDIDGIVVFGGDTAFAILHELGDPPLDPIGEVVPGVPAARIDWKRTWDRVQVQRDLFLVTKAGGFGPAGILSVLEAELAHP